MTIDENQVVYKKKVGKLNGAPVVEIGLKGGLHLILAAKNGRFETLGAGPHRAVARFIARKREEKIEFSDLNKADHVEPEHFSWLLPRYEAMTDALRKTQGL